MADIAQRFRKVDRAMTVYNGTGADIGEGLAVALDSTNTPAVVVTSGSPRAPGVKLTTDDTDCVGFAHAKLRAGWNESIQTAGIAIGIAGADITFGTTKSLMSDSSGHVIPRTAGKRSCGIPLHSASAGDPIQFRIEFSNGG